jgi:hypothetical protein
MFANRLNSNSKFFFLYKQLALENNHSQKNSNFPMYHLNPQKLVKPPLSNIKLEVL